MMLVWVDGAYFFEWLLTGEKPAPKPAPPADRWLTDDERRAEEYWDQYAEGEGDAELWGCTSREPGEKRSER